MQQITPQDIRERQIKELAEADGYTFIGWVDESETRRKRLVMECPTHGKWVTRFDNYIKSHTKCSGCSKGVLTREQHELFLHSVAAQRGYVFIGWVTEYTNVKSKIAMLCPTHGEFIRTLNAMRSRSTECPKCANSILTISEVEKQLVQRADDNGYIFTGWVNTYRGTASKVIIECATHGKWAPSVSNFLSGKGCYQCGRDGASERLTRSLGDVIDLLNDRALEMGVKFVKFKDAYVNQYSRVIMTCPEHGEYTQQIVGVNQGKQCRKCSLGQMNEVQQSERLSGLATANKLEFIGYHDGYNGVHGKAIFRCAEHGEWICSINSFVSAGSRCPSCAEYGYNPSKSATLYALLSDCGSMIKIGISNVPDKRHAKLRRCTPFEFAVYRELSCDDGTIPPMLEQMFHDEFPSAGLRGFDGATEWRLWHDDVNTWFDLLSG